jgi:hypothetical protein
MSGRPLLLAVLMAIPAAAQDAMPLATYWENSGTLPPEFAWDLSVTILADGSLSLTYCRGYQTEGPACAVGRAHLTNGDVEAILTAARASGLAGRPAESLSDSEVPVGGGSRGGSVTLDGTAIGLPAFPREPDATRVAALLDAIAATVPPGLVADAERKAKAP